MSKNQYTVSLTGGQRRSLKRMINSGDAPAFQVRNARILLRSDRGNRTDKAIAKEFKISVNSVERLQKRFAVEGMDTAVETRVNVNVKDANDKDVNIVVNAATDEGTFVDFGKGQVDVATDGKTSVTYPGGSIKVGNGVFITDAAFEVSTMPTGDTTVVFPGGGVSYTSSNGQVAIRYPDGSVFYSQTEGLEVKYLGGQVTFSSGATDVQFPGGNVAVKPGGDTSVLFPGGFVNVGGGGINISFG
jgi:hypothetical protein